MTQRLVLDTNILGKLCHPKMLDNNLLTWFTQALVEARYEFYIPEIVDYELRRELIRLNSTKSLSRLDQLEEQLDYLPIDTRDMRTAADFWAQARRRGKPTASDAALDGDVILAAQAKSVDGVVFTENAKHLSLFVEVRTMSDLIQPT